MRKTSRNLSIFCFLVAFWIFDCEALCGFNRTASLDVAILNTPGYPRNYNSSQDCQWTLEATSGYRVQFTVHGGGSEACCDYLEVFDGPSIYNPSLGRVKGTVSLTRPFTSTTRHLTVRFVSDDSIEGRGFNGSYNLHRIECVARSDPANSISLPSKSSWFINDGVTYLCEDGYQLLGSATSRCDNNGEWTNYLPVCAALPESRFYMTDVQLNFEQSRQRCRSRGGDLAIIHNQQEQDYLTAKAKRLYPGGATFYIGLERVGSAWIFNSGYLQWINGKRVGDGYHNWNTGEPNYGAANENCGTMFIAEETFWNDIACFRRFFAVCETVYNPCINNPCLNGGNCSKRKNTFSCECPAYVDGDRCENVTQCPAPVLHRSLNTVPPRNADSYRVGTRFRLTCDSGKFFVGSPKEIECQSNESWSETSGVCSTCASRNLTAARAVNRLCGEMCQEGSGGCRSGKICKCDHECGYSCISRGNTCGHPPQINHTQSAQVKRNRNGKISLMPYPPYQYDDFVEYVCGPGYELSQFKPTMCHSRRSWTRERTFCIRTCEDNNINDRARNVLSCRDRCTFDRDCNHGEQCLCDGNCGRSCVYPDIDCGEAPTSSNAAINYTGQGFYRVAHYSCAEGFYLVSGSPRRKCTGRRIYDGNLPDCARVKCSDPFVAFQATGGVVPDIRTKNYSVDAQVKFRCPSTHRLLGPTSRTCLTDGRWSGQDSACDVIDTTTRCPHPGVPINGRLVTNSNFSVGSVIQFRCDPGYVMLGEHEQECMYFLQWSNLGAPQCIDTDISNINVRAIDQIQNSIEELRDSPITTSVGRISSAYVYKTVEIYLVVDISSSEGENCFDQSNKILKEILSKMYGSENTIFRITLIAYATRADVVHQPESGDSGFSKQDILKELEKLSVDKDNLRKKLGSSSNLNKALHLLINLTKSSPETKKLIYITSCEHQDEDENTVLEQNSVIQFKAHFEKQKSEIFVFLVCVKCKSTLETSENVLLSIASSYDHAFAVKASSQSFIDPLRGIAQQATDETEAVESCGKAGDTTTVKNRALYIHSTRQKSKEGAWPWHAVITRKVNYRHQIKYRLLGGGSLIDNRWVLTVAHLFSQYTRFDQNWHRDYTVILGAHKLNMATKMFQLNAKIFVPEKIILHENYKIDLPEDSLQDFDFDVALIKLGREYDLLKKGRFVPSARSGWVNYSSFIRPVCLPCMENNCIKGWAESQEKMNSNRSETQSPEDKCAIEENMFMTHKHSVTVIIGFGKTANERTSQHLLQGRVKIKSRDECSAVLPQMRHAVNEAVEPLQQNFTYTNRMLCALGEYGGYVTDAGPGESGGALTREIYDEATKTSCWIQLGIVSWGYDNDNLFSTNGTRRNFPGYYTNVFSVLNWINDKVHPTQGTCEPKNINKIAQFGFTCGSPCVTDRDCNVDELCLCDGNCGRSCVNPGVDCGEAPASSNAVVNYTGKGFHRVAHYSCAEGFYLVSGSQTRKCTGSGIYDGDLPHCSRIECSDPFVAFEATGGEVASHRLSKYSIGAQVEFRCPSTHRLLGPTSRTCLINGRWSGLESTCDLNAQVAVEEFENCGEAGDTKGTQNPARVIHGRKARRGAWPWHALISKTVYALLELSNSIHGGGTLINHQWVLTAAHLFAEVQRSEGWHRNYRIVLGTHMLSMTKKKFSSDAKFFEPEKIILHESFKTNLTENNLQNFDYDVALIKLGREYDLSSNKIFYPSARIGWVNYTSLIRPVCLPCMENSCVKRWAKSQGKWNSISRGGQTTANNCEAEEDMFVAHNSSKNVVIGYGRISPDDKVKLPKSLRQARVDIKSSDECSSAIPHMHDQELSSAGYLSDNYTYSDRMLCALGEYDNFVTDACQGDSGGGLIREISDEVTNTSCWIQLGIISWGYKCAKSYLVNGEPRYYPGYYTNVFSVINWIKSHIDHRPALCGFNGTASLEDAILNTPGYPRNYNSSQDCQWTLRATSGYKVQFTVHSGETEVCCDYLEVFDGLNKNSPSLGRVRGNVSVPRSFLSTSGHLTVRFVSDYAIERRGFSGSYNLRNL